MGGFLHFYSGVAKLKGAKAGISIVIHKKLNEKIWREINERLIKIKLEKLQHTIEIIAVYAPTDDAPLT